MYHYTKAFVAAARVAHRFDTTKAGQISGFPFQATRSSVICQPAHHETCMDSASVGVIGGAESVAEHAAVTVAAMFVLYHIKEVLPKINDASECSKTAAELLVTVKQNGVKLPDIWVEHVMPTPETAFVKCFCRRRQQSQGQCLKCSICRLCQPRS